MSTRCQVKIKDKWGELWFYRHSDGYPEGALPTLTDFMERVKDGRIRDNIEQAGGWLVLIGAKEYNVKLDVPGEYDFNDWKCGAYEPSVPERHGDIDYLYTLDLINLTIDIEHIRDNSANKIINI